jgi:hypothetical protein
MITLGMLDENEGGKMIDRGSYMAMARARSSESSQARDIHAMLRGCEKVPKV